MDDIDTRLEADLLQVPDDFTEQVMRRIDTLPRPTKTSQRRERLQWLALLGGAALGLSQLLAFMFGMWAASAAM
ncbi:MAG: hypothetical protein QM749_02220 [Aquabacterium sp.]